MCSKQGEDGYAIVNKIYHFLMRAFVFVVIFVVLLAGINSFLQPVWFYENNYHTTRSFYDEPADTIETVFVGASMTLFGFSPMEMYEQNGICAYNLASTSQPMMMSYYWIREAHSLHGKTMDTAVLDVSMLRRIPKEEDYRKALDGMRPGRIKDEAIEAHTTNFFDLMGYHLPVFNYHDRWSSIDYTDFIKYNTNLEDYARGFFMEYSKIFDQYSPDEIPVPAQILDPEAKPFEFETESLYYFKKTIEFCQENNIRLVLCKTPSPSNWSSSEHNAVQQIADQYGIDFLDFEMEPLISDIKYNPPLDSKDTNKHLNSFGAMKLSHWMSTYLAEECGNRDVRGDARYHHLDDQLKRYRNKVDALQGAVLSEDVASYLKNIIEGDNYTVLIAVRDEASSALTVDQRFTLSELGLKELGNIGYRDAYLAVVSNGKVEYEERAVDPASFGFTVDQNIQQREDEQIEEGAVEVTVNDLEGINEGDWQDDEEEPTSITYKGTMVDGMSFTLVSGGFRSGNTTSCMIGEEEFSKSSRGINIVVYDNDSHRVVDSASFDTHASSTRPNPDVQTALDAELAKGTRYSKLTPELQKLYRYNRRFEYNEEAKRLRLELGPTGLYYYLQNFNRGNLMIFVAVKDDASTMLSYEARMALVNMGFTGIGELGFHDSYCAVFEGGTVKQEVLTHDSEVARIEGRNYTLESGGFNAGNTASIVIENDGYSKDYANNARGFNIVVYNPKLGIVVDRTSFDTYENPVDVPVYEEPTDAFVE